MDIAACTVGSGTITAVPIPGMEVPKQVALTASDIVMYTTIWKLYFFEEALSRTALLDRLVELGIVAIAATGTAYVAARITTAILNEVCDEIGLLGWGVSAAIAGSITALFGMAWLLYCESLCTSRELKSMVIDNNI